VKGILLIDPSKDLSFLNAILLFYFLLIILNAL